MGSKAGKVIVGLGETGLSVARYFHNAGAAYSVMDDNPSPNLLPALLSLNHDVMFSSIDAARLLLAEEIIVSPGVPLSRPELRQACQQGVPITGDVAMFGALASAPIAAITGSNGKTTVTALLAHLARAQRAGVQVGGNIGTPCLDLLDDASSLYIIEVSSYQLELATSVPARVAVVLNLAPDHQDRYESTNDYYAAKENVYNNCQVALVNRDIDYDFSLPGDCVRISYGSDLPDNAGDFGLLRDGEEILIVKGTERLVDIRQLPIKGRHNALNVMAAVALGSVLELDMSRMLDSLQSFQGLAHRCEWVAEIDGVDFYNDSKATNVASTVAAVQSLAEEQQIVLILGGLGKDADFSPLQQVFDQSIAGAVVFGQDRVRIAEALGDARPLLITDTMEQAIDAASGLATKGSCVLFSPACASQDMFRDYGHRGDCFRDYVKGMGQ